MDIFLDRLNDIDAEQALEDPFFGAASKLLLRSVAALANASQYPDLLTCVAILTAKNLAALIEDSEIDASIRASFTQSLGLHFSDLTRASIQGTAMQNLRPLLPGLLDLEEMTLRRAELERLLPFDESIDFPSSDSIIAQFDSSEAAERAAWMLQGECVNQTQVIVPKHNANAYALDAIAALVGSRWTWVKASDESA
jgi:hypothetical protein